MTNNRHNLERDSVLRIGSVVSVDGRSIRIRVDKEKNVSHLMFGGQMVRNVAVNSYVRISKGFEQIVGKIDGEFVSEDLPDLKSNYRNRGDKILRILKVSLVGFFEGGRFKKGIKELPLIDSECFLLDEREVQNIHNFVDEGDVPFPIGTLAAESNRELSVGINSLFASHLGIFGNTGSGKSYTLASLYWRLFSKFKSSANFRAKANFFVIDFNGEYVDYRENATNKTIVEPEFKNSYKLSTKQGGGDRFPVPEKILEDEILWMIVLDATEKTQVPFIRRAIKNDQLNLALTDGDSLKRFIADTIFEITQNSNDSLERSTVSNFLSDLLDVVSEYSNGLLQAKIRFDGMAYHSIKNVYMLNTTTGTVYSDNPGRFRPEIDGTFSTVDINVEDINPIRLVRLKLVLKYYSEIVKGYSNKEHLAPMMKRLEQRVNDLEKVIAVDEAASSRTDKNLTVVSLRDVNVHMRKMLPLLFCRQLYEKKKQESDKTKYLNIIVDEAHNILSLVSQRESEQWKDYRLETFEEIIKEGRKFGVFLTIASQRPHDISPTIISQLHNYFLHRLINNNDIAAIEKTVSYLDKVSFDSLPILPTGTCILAGLAAQIPVLVKVGAIDPDYEPFNQTIRPVSFWD